MASNSPERSPDVTAAVPLQHYCSGLYFYSGINKNERSRISVK